MNKFGRYYKASRDRKSPLGFTAAVRECLRGRIRAGIPVIVDVNRDVEMLNLIMLQIYRPTSG